MINKSAKGYIFAAMGAMGWALSGMSVQLLFGCFPQLRVQWVTSWRMISAGILLLIISRFTNKEQPLTAVFKNKKDTLWLVAFAVLGLAECQYTYFSAVKYGNSATASVLQSVNVVIMSVSMSIWHKRPMTKYQILALILAMSGVYLIATNGNPNTLVVSTLGVFFGLISALGVVFYSLLSRPIITTWGNTYITGWGMIIGGLTLGSVSRIWEMPTGLDLRFLLFMTIIVVIGTAGAFSIFLEGNKIIGPVRSTLMGCLEPAAGLFFAWAFLNTKFGVFQLLGFVMIIATVFLSVKGDME